MLLRNVGLCPNYMTSKLMRPYFSLLLSIGQRNLSRSSNLVDFTNVSHETAASIFIGEGRFLQNVDNDLPACRVLYAGRY
jgi:hypothetical protein